FYEGDIAESIVNYLRSKGGFIELDDFRDYRSFWGEPLRTDYRGYQVFETPPNTQGVTTLHILKLLSTTDLSNVKLLSSDEVKLFLKCFKAAYKVRDKYVCDPRYVSKDLLGPEVINELLTEFEGTSANVGRRLNTSLGDTTYYVVIDREGNVVSGIQSIFYAFGSGITEPKYGITLNCRGSSFTLIHGDVNELAPRKYPLHTLSTTIIFDSRGSLKWVLGTSGGHYRPQIHVELITSLVDYGLDVQKAVELPRFLWDLSTDELIVEEGVDTVGVGGVKVRRVNYPSRLGVAAVVEFLGSIKVGASDIRGDGLALSIEYP
ncbi:MAG: gamma-glutamyltransferase, partial [Sulfolobales archaeon]